MPDTEILELLSDLDPAEVERLISSLPEQVAAVLLEHMDMEQRAAVTLLPGQQVPEVPISVLSGGRGSGKTFSGSNWLAGILDEYPHVDHAIVAPTFSDARDVNIEGIGSGLLALRPHLRAGWMRSEGVLRLPEGGRVFIDGSLDGAERVQGKNLASCWVDEIGLTRGPRGRRAWEESIRFAVRVEPARILVTGTPKAANASLIKDIEAQADHVVRLRTADNPHLPERVVAAYQAAYGNTRLGRQELHGELVEGSEGALWHVDWLDRSRVDVLPDGDYRRVVAVDPASGSGTTGIVAVAMDTRTRHVYVTDDVSVVGGTPEQWAGAAVRLAEATGGTILAEDNQGGRMVRSVLESTGTDLPVRLVHATLGKAVRAEPAALLWEKTPPEAHLVGGMPDLESELITWEPGDRNSPDRLDAMAHGIVWLRGTAVGPARVARPTGSLPR